MAPTDLQKVHKDLDQQIRQIRDEKKELAKELEAARAAIAAQKAELNQQIKLLRERDLTSLYGQIEVANKTISDLQKDFDTHKDNFSTTTGALQSDSQSIETTMKSHGEQLQTSQAQTTTLTQQIDENNQSITKQLTDFQTAFGEFKHTLTDIGTELTTETQRSDELAQLISQLQDTVKQTGILIGTRLDEHVVEEATHQTELRQQVVTLQNKLNTDTQALRTFLEQDVKAAMDQLVTDMDDRQRPVVQRMDALQSDMEALGLHLQADATQVQELSQSFVKLREAQDVMGSLLGKRGDEILKQAGGLSERMNTIESHQTTLTQQLQSNTKKTSTHLTEVNASLTSISQSLKQTTQSLSQRLTQQEKTIGTLNQGIQQSQQLKDKTEGQIQQMQTANQLTDQLRQSVEQINARLQDLGIGRI